MVYKVFAKRPTHIAEVSRRYSLRILAIPVQ